MIAGLCFFFIFLYCSELTQCVYCGLFCIFWSNEKVCGIHTCFRPISVVCAVHLARFVSSGVSAYQNLKVCKISSQSGVQQGDFVHCSCFFAEKCILVKVL